MTNPDESAANGAEKKATGKNADASAIIRVAGKLAECPNPFDTGDAGRAPKILACASLPYKRPKPEQLVNGSWVRENGDYSLVVQGGLQGIPYGMYPRLFLFWLTNEVHRTGERTISTGSSFAEFCRQLQIDTSQGKRGPGKNMIEQVERLLDSRISYVARQESKRSIRSDASHMGISDDRHLFWDAGHPEQESLFESYIVLTERFFKELTENYIPLDMRVVNAIKVRKSPLELDILLWLSYRLYSLHQQKNHAMVSWEQLYSQFGSGFSRLRDFRNQGFIPALNAIRAIYPQADVYADDKGLLLGPGGPLIPRKLHQVGGPQRDMFLNDPKKPK